MKTAVVGLGAMGSGMAVNLHRAGLLCAAWNRSPARASTLAADHGLPISDDLAHLAAQAELIITCVSADDDLREVVGNLKPHLRPGTILLDTSTVNAATARELAKVLSTIEVAFLDGPVSGGKEGAWNGKMVMMVGGDAALLERIHPVLEVITSKVAHMGPVGSGQATKAVNQIMAAGINQAVTEALAFGQKQGLDMDQLVELLSGGAAGNWFLAHRGKSMVRDQFEPGFKLALHHKDLKICQAMAAESGVKLPVIEMTLVHYQRLMEAGFGEDDISGLFRLKRGLFEKFEV